VALGILLGVGCLWSLVGSPEGSLAQCPRATQKLFLEYDHIRTTYAATSMVNGQTLEDAYCEWPLIEVTALKTEVPKDPNLQLDPNVCISQASLDGLVVKTKNASRPANSWYAHGLVVPNKGYKDASGKCWEPKGKLWLLPLGDICSILGAKALSGVREDFVLFFAKREGRNPGQLQDDAMQTGVHELAHVLNSHHCEIYADDIKPDGKIRKSGPVAQHLDERVKLPAHVAPGCGGDLWCATDPNWHVQQLHRGCATACGTASAEMETSAKLVESGVTLVVEPEKETYIPGEPIHVTVTLRRDASKAATHSALQYFSEGSLDPQSGYLGFHVARTADPKSQVGLLPPGSSSFTPLQPPGYDDVDLPVAKLTLDDPPPSWTSGIWFTLPQTGVSGEEPFWLNARYAGFKDRDLLLSSSPVLVRVGLPLARPELYDPNAQALFTHPEARRFLFLMGGDHLTVGMNNLDRVVTEYPRTIYAAYAALALGVSWANSYLGLDDHGVLVERPARPDVACGYLRKAAEPDRRALLSPFYERLLVETMSLAGGCAVQGEP